MECPSSRRVALHKGDICSVEARDGVLSATAMYRTLSTAASFGCLCQIVLAASRVCVSVAMTARVPVHI